MVGKGVQALRAEGHMPAVVYSGGEEALAIQLAERDFKKVFAEAGESTVITLSIDGEEKSVLIQDVDLDPVTSYPRHADFYAIKKGQKVKVEVPIEFVGESEAVKTLGANLVKVLHELEIEGEATALPHHIEVSIEPLKNFEDQILAGSISLPAGITLMSGADEVVAIAAKPEEEKVEEAAPDMSAIEISEERGKKEKEAEPGEE